MSAMDNAVRFAARVMIGVSAMGMVYNIGATVALASGPHPWLAVIPMGAFAVIWAITPWREGWKDAR